MKELEIKNQTIKNQEELINSLKESIINLKDIIDINEKQLILSGVVKLFTAEQVLKELKENETLDDAISFFTNIK